MMSKIPNVKEVREILMNLPKDKDECKISILDSSFNFLVNHLKHIGIEVYIMPISGASILIGDIKIKETDTYILIQKGEKG